MLDKTVGVYLPTKNRVELLKKAVESVLAQTYKNFKLLVIDDGSTDGTQAYLDSITDPRVNYIRNEQSERACKARNRAIKALDTELVTGLDDDDVFLPERLECLLKAYDPKYAFLCSGYYWDYGAFKKSLFTKSKTISLSAALDLNQCSNQILVNRKRVLSVGGFDPSLSALQDHDLWVRLIARYGDAYRVGKELYIVNDDHSLERISNSNNKLNAVNAFEKKHYQLMNKNNLENFAFYKRKIQSEEISLKELFASFGSGLKYLKARYYLSTKFNVLSSLRLKLLRKETSLVTFIYQMVIPLIATGGPGASRVILLSSAIYFLGVGNTSEFGSDFFIVMLLNTAFCQCFAFFLLKKEFSESFNRIALQSLFGLMSSVLLLFTLNVVNLVENFLLSSALLIILHFYYLLRYQFIGEQRFGSLAVSEIVISTGCVVTPWIASSYAIVDQSLIYLLYITSSLLGLICLISRANSQVNDNKVVPFKNVFNISISTTASILSVFLLPSLIKESVEPAIVSLVALSISCLSVALLIPRTYANKVIKSLADENLCHKELNKIQNKYKKLVVLSASIGLLGTYMYLFTISGVTELWALAIGICFILVSAQFGFVALTSLSLRGKDSEVAKLNLATLIISLGAILIYKLSTNSITMLYFVLLIICVTFSLRNILAFRHLSNLENGTAR